MRTILLEKTGPHYQFKKTLNWFLGNKICCCDTFLDLFFHHEYQLNDFIIDSSAESGMLFKMDSSKNEIAFHYGLIYFLTLPKSYFLFDQYSHRSDMLNDSSFQLVFNLLLDTFKTDTLEITYDVTQDDKVIFFVSFCNIDFYDKKKYKKIDFNKLEKLYYKKIKKTYDIFVNEIKGFNRPIFSLLEYKKPLTSNFEEEKNGYFVNPKKAEKNIIIKIKNEKKTPTKNKIKK